jgi:NADP-dependent 3-hydroxy acid dehydrogenase YdfG
MKEGEVAVVTGVTSGIGEAIAEGLIAAGAIVAGIGRSADKLAATERKLGDRFFPFEVDLSSPEQRNRRFREISERFGAIRALVNNAAEVQYDSPLEIEPERWRALFEVNLHATLDLASMLAPRLTRGGHVVNISSITARFLPNVRFAPYAITKVAMEELTSALRLELDPKGIKVTLVAPGLVDTPIYDKVRGFEKTKAKVKEQVPRWLDSKDVAEAVLWCLSRPEHVVIGELTILPQGQAR